MVGSHICHNVAIDLGLMGASTHDCEVSGIVKERMVKLSLDAGQEGVEIHVVFGESARLIETAQLNKTT